MAETNKTAEDAGQRRKILASSAYRLETVARACALLRVFGEGESLRLHEIVTRTSLDKSVAFRLVRTLEEAGFLHDTGGKRYRCAVRFPAAPKYRMGFATLAENSPFSAAVTESLRHAAAKESVELIVLNNRYSARAALRNAGRLVAERVDLVFEFQMFDRVAGRISALFQEAGIPMVAIDIPHPGATFYGANNYRLGLTAGQAAARWAKQNWDGKVDRVILLEARQAGVVPQLRIEGVEAGIHRILPLLGSEAFIHVDARGEFDKAMEEIRRLLRLAPSLRTLVVGLNDPSTLGALRGFEEAGLLNSCAGVALGATAEARAELIRPGSRLIGAVALFPELYGGDLIQLALDILAKRHTPPAIFAHHQLITVQNLARYYPHDARAQSAASFGN
ncbi:MAG: substrate-binding domain-containing protein [Bryobacterales bacterium]|nr:substrate-binding domain-containing protein [Bryobacterales bacterium]